MNLHALFLCALLAGCSNLPVVSAQEIDPDSYAAADIAAIQKEADDLDIDQLVERMDAMRDGVWQGKAPAAPAGPSISIELFVSSSFARSESSALLWRDATGRWDWHRATHNGDAPAETGFKTAGGVVDAAHSAELERMLDSAERRAEIWFSPPATPLKGTSEENKCFDGASFLMAIRRAGQPEELVVQSCTTRWLNGDLINLIGGIGRG